MLPLKDQQFIDRSIEHFTKSISALCCVSSCNEPVVNVFKTIEKRILPMCKGHFEIIAAKTLW